MLTNPIPAEDCGCVYDQGTVVIPCDDHAESLAEGHMEMTCPGCGHHEDDCECPDGAAC